MAGIFGFFDFTKPGRGVRKDEPQKKGVARFFELFFRKFWNYLKLNLLYFITSIPAFIYYVFLLTWLLGDLLITAGAPQDDMISGILLFSAMFAMIIIMFCAGSPCVTGYTYILRNYVREEHAWLLSDFFEHTRKNFKQGLAAFLIDIAVITVFLINIRFYLIMCAQGTIYLVLICIFAILLIIYFIMHTYIWTMMVTFSLKLKQIYKNAFLLSFLALPRNLGGIIVRGAIAGFLFFSFINELIALLLCVFIMISAMGLIAQMFSYPVIKKYMLDKIENSEEEYVEDEEDIYGDEDIDDIDYPEILNENDVASLFKNKNREEEQ